MNQSYIIRLVSIDSTNNYAREILKKGTPEEGTVIISDFQTSGKGFDNNFWESEDRSNLTFTIILYPTFLKVEQQIILNKTIALSIFDFIKLTDNTLNVKIKWPNDIYIDDNKVAGILIENTLNGNMFSVCIAGIGININQKVFSSDAPNPTSLSLETEKTFEIDKCLSQLLNCIDKRYNMLKMHDYKTIDDDYLKNMYRLNKYFNFLYEEKLITAKLTGVTEFGRLMLSTVNKEDIECDIKEIKFII
jgi:BirA family transcriptional regulator, biotin operon repressor / biotin---[acetyl-CoA-carboxylase] ligase